MVEDLESNEKYAAKIEIRDDYSTMNNEHKVLSQLQGEIGFPFAFM